MHLSKPRKCTINPLHVLGDEKIRIQIHDRAFLTEYGWGGVFYDLNYCRNVPIAPSKRYGYWLLTLPTIELVLMVLFLAHPHAHGVYVPTRFASKGVSDNQSSALRFTDSVPSSRCRGPGASADTSGRP